MTDTWSMVDDAYRRALACHRGAGGWLLLQTLLTAIPRRALYGALDLGPGARLLDVGTGHGPVALELAASTGCHATGIDTDGAALAVARRVRDELTAAGLLAGEQRPAPTAGHVAGPPTPPARPATGGARVDLLAADVTVLPFGAATFDAAVCRFLLQHVPNPAAAVAETCRVIRPGGLVYLIDVDEGLSLVHPPPPEPMASLRQAFATVQNRRGGDRSVGRRLGALLADAGCDVEAVLVVPHAAYGPSAPTDVDRRFVLDRFTEAADDMVAGGLLSADVVRRGLHQLATVHLPPRTTVEAHLAALGRRR